MKILGLGGVVAALLLSASVQAWAEDPISIPAPSFLPDDTWAFSRTHQKGSSNFTQQIVDLKVDRVNGDIMFVGIKPDGAPVDFQDHLMGADWSQRRIVDGQETVTGRPFNFPMTVGKTWISDYVEPKQYGLQTFARFHTTYKVVGWQDVVVPAGKFHVLKIEANGTIEAQMAAATGAATGGLATSSGGTAVAQIARSPAHTLHAIEYSEFYYSPDVKYYVKSLIEQYDSDNILTSRETDSLVSFTPGH